MQAYQSAPCPYCGATWNPPGAQACVNCHNALPPSQPAYAPPGYAPGPQPGQPGAGQDPQAGYPYGQPGYPPPDQQGNAPAQPQYPGQPAPGYPPAYQGQPYGGQPQGPTYPTYQPPGGYQQGGYPGGGNPYAGYPGAPTAAPAAPNSVTLFGRQITLPFPLPAGLNQQRLRTMALGAAGFLVFLVLFFGILPGIASGQITGADQSLSAAYGHQSKADAAMNGYLKSTSASTPDAERTRINKELQVTQDALTLVQQDESALQSADQRLAIFAWVAFPKRAAISAERHRISLALGGLRSADQALTAFADQDKLALPLYDAGQDYIKIATALGRHDLAGAGAPYPDIHQKMQDALGLAQASGIPKEIQKFVNDFSDLVENTEKLIQAAQAKDNAGIQKYSALVTAEAKTVAAFDGGAVDAANRKTYQPMIDAYDAGLKSAKNS